MYRLLSLVVFLSAATTIANESSDRLEAHQELLTHLEVVGGRPSSAARPINHESETSFFLSSPLPAAHPRVTSVFSANRYHPVLHHYRPHNGVDYAAAEGTPVRATAAGTVVMAEYDSGGGNVVQIDHGAGRLTAYLHLSRFAHGLQKSSEVKRGEVVGYVGSTGLSTGPHLEYRIQVDGNWVDPLGLW